MIDLNNVHCYISPEMRRTCLQRAIYTQPYYYRMSIPFSNVDVKQANFANVLGVDRDFFLTELQGNFGEVFVNATSLFNANVYTGYNRSVYSFDNLKKIPSGFIFQEARLQQAQPTLSFFDDRQQERFPFLIRRNDRIYVELIDISLVQADDVVEVVLKGFNVLDDVYLTPVQTEQCNNSLARDVEWQYFKVDIDVNEDKPYYIENDNKTRLLLGFGAVTSVAETPLIDISLTDITRRLRLTDTAIPLQFLAPRMPAVQDSHIYYLPVEYYLQPYAKLELDVKYTQSGGEFVPVEIAALTRTV